jgi:hypothetical protein
MVFNIDDPGSALVEGINGITALINGANVLLGEAFENFEGSLARFRSLAFDLDPNQSTGETGASTEGTTNSDGQPASVPGAGDAAHAGGTAEPISFTPDDFRNAVVQAFMELMANGGLPVDVRNFRDMPRPSPYSSA